ncbi:MAG: DUF3108 domain-containing protein, partial [Bacteroidales bacterium]|nr:DUF3108 domain-containing protein [Bacteroidales bacterium]
DAGEVSFKTDTTGIENKAYYYFDSHGRSYKFYDWFFKVRDRFQSTVDTEKFQPYWFTRNTYEGGYEVNIRYDFDFENGTLISTIENSDEPMSIEKLKLDSCTFDVLTAIYYARNINYDLYKAGDTIPVKFIIDGEFYELYIRLLGKEMIKNRNGKKYSCIKLSALLVEGTMFKGGEDLFVWVTDDKNRIPVMVEAKILIGSVKAYLTGYEGLKYDLEAVILDQEKN